MSNFNLFAWIRDGVRQSVLLGVSDAIEHIGTPVGAEDVRPHLKSLLQPRDAAVLPERTAAETAGRKRLGRSLKDLDLPGRSPQ